MAVTVAQSAKKFFSGSASTTLAFSSAVSAGSLLVVAISGYTGNAGTASVSDSVNGSYTRIYWTTGGDGSLILAMYYKYNSGAGTPTVTVNMGDAGTATSFTILEAQGVKSSADPLDGSDTNTATSTAVSAGPVTPTITGDLIVGNMTSMAGGVVTITPSANYTQLQEYEDGASQIHMNVMYRVYASTSAETATWTLGSSLGNIGGMALFKEAPAIPTSLVMPTINKRIHHLLVR